jgi:hypothetical protein
LLGQHQLGRAELCASIARIPFLQRFFWANTGFGAVKELPDLDEMDFRFHVRLPAPYLTVTNSSARRDAGR